MIPTHADRSSGEVAPHQPDDIRTHLTVRGNGKTVTPTKVGLADLRPIEMKDLCQAASYAVRELDGGATRKPLLQVRELNVNKNLGATRPERGKQS